MNENNNKFKTIFWIITSFIILGIASMATIVIASGAITEEDIMPSIIVGVFCLFVLLIPIIIGILVYKDAKRLQMNPWMWTLIAMYVPNLIGLIIYLVVRSNENKKSRCIDCGATLESDYNICPNCGHQLADVCSNCGRYVKKGFSKCPYCGKDLEQK